MLQQHLIVYYDQIWHLKVLWCLERSWYPFWMLLPHKGAFKIIESLITNETKKIKKYDNSVISAVTADGLEPLRFRTSAESDNNVWVYNISHVMFTKEAPYFALLGKTMRINFMSFWKTICWHVETRFNLLRPSDAIWWHRSGSTLSQVMACCHYQNQCWLIISKIKLHSSDGNFTRDTSVIKDQN